jgi:hypothetical protein
MTPSLPTAQPCRLSAAKRKAWMMLPCGSGFCHSQPRRCASAVTPKHAHATNAAAAASARSWLKAVRRGLGMRRLKSRASA